MKRIYLLLMLLALSMATFVYAQFPAPSPTWRAQDVKGNAGRIFSVIYGSHIVGCTQTATTTTGHNRSGPYLVNRTYKIYGYNTTGLVGETIKCAMGGSSVDVTALAGSKVGDMIFASQPEYWTFLDSSNLHISCISATATKHYDVCEVSY